MKLQARVQLRRLKRKDRSPFRPRRFAFLLSAVAHILVFGLPPALEELQWLPSMETRQLNYVVTMTSLRREKSLEQKPLYEPELPKIAPVERIGKTPEPQGRIKSERTVVIVQSPRPLSKKQHIWQPETNAELKTEVQAPNIITLRAPARRFEIPRTVSGSSGEQPRTIPLPKVDVRGAALPKGDSAFSQVPRAAPPPPPRKFTPPARPPLLEAPRQEPVIEPMSKMLETGRHGLPSGSLIDKAAQEELAGFKGKLPTRPFQPPPETSGSGTGRGGVGGKEIIEQLPPTIAPGTGGQQDLAVVGLQPEPTVSSIPKGNLPGEFSQAPKLGEPSSGETARADTPRIPGVAVVGSGSGAVPPAPRVSIPQSKVRFEMAAPPYATTTSAPLRPSARTLPATIESVFQGRVVYTLVVPRPDLPEYLGDWIVWFAVQGESADSVPQVRPPFPYKKYEDQYSRAPNNQNSKEEGWVRLRAVLGKDGKLESVNPMGRMDKGLSESAIQDVKTWEFRPATSNGVAVDVEMVLEIPVRLPVQLVQK
jgi:Gram-negative bacterial TonB protein C-terminal